MNTRISHPHLLKTLCLVLLNTCVLFSSFSVFGQQLELGTENLDLLQTDDFFFKDHNKNGTLDLYEDWRLSAQERAEHLVSVMTIEEKAGAMLHGTLPIDQSENSNALNYDLVLAEELVQDRNINHIVTRLRPAKSILRYVLKYLSFLWITQNTVHQGTIHTFTNLVSDFSVQYDRRDGRTR